jgi:hypothetical protein
MTDGIVRINRRIVIPTCAISIDIYIYLAATAIPRHPSLPHPSLPTGPFLSQYNKNSFHIKLLGIAYYLPQTKNKHRLAHYGEHAPTLSSKMSTLKIT